MVRSGGGHHVVAGRLVRAYGYKPGVHFVDDPSKIPLIADGGCSVVSISYDFDTHQFASPPKCNGVA